MSSTIPGKPNPLEKTDGIPTRNEAVVSAVETASPVAWAACVPLTYRVAVPALYVAATKTQLFADARPVGLVIRAKLVELPIRHDTLPVLLTSSRQPWPAAGLQPRRQQPAVQAGARGAARAP
jgi:hypothetical protein